MTYFSRLTDIVTCNLSEILARESDPAAAIQEIIREMEEGLAGATRSVNTAQANENRIGEELQEHSQRAEHWAKTAREALAAGSEDDARLALVRKREVEDLVAGLEQQHSAAASTRAHLTTTLRALEARLAEARRKLVQFESGDFEDEAAAIPQGRATRPTDPSSERAREIDAELQALKRELGQ